MKWLSLLVAPILLALLVQPGQALAHAHLVRADLAPNSHLKVSVGTVRFWFDEPLNPALSRIVLLNRQGQQVTDDTGALNPHNDEELDLTVPTLPDGVYTVRWTSDSAQDGHIMHGFYLFTVGGPGAVAPPTVPAAISSPPASLDMAAGLIALAQWLALLATVVWTGAVALETLVLAPARRQAGRAPPALAVLGSQRVLPIMQVGLLATLGTSALELAVQVSVAADAGNSLGTTTVVGAILGSPYGSWLIVRLALACCTLLVIASARGGRLARAVAGGGVLQLTGDGASAVLVLGGGRQPAAPTRPLGVLTGRLLSAIALAYLLALALSGHAAAVPHLQITAVVLDWLHLIASAIWIGGMAAIALALLPARERSTELLALLDRFSPAAYLALITAAATGMFNAQIRIDSLATLTGTLYGRLLLIKLALIGTIVVLSALHVLGTRPRLRALAASPSHGAGVRLQASLERRLRVEPVLGVFILLCVALMGQVAPSPAAFNATVVSVTTDQSSVIQGGPISAVEHLGALTVHLLVSPADVGQAQLTATIAEHDRVVTDGQVRLKLTMPATPNLGAAFVETTPSAGSYSGWGDLVQEGVWKADVLVRTHDDAGEFRDVPFVFVASAEPAFLSAPSRDLSDGVADVRLQSPAGAGAVLEIHLRSGLRVRDQVTMADMSPQVGDLQPRAGGWYRGIVVPPMEGYINLAIQVQQGRAWHTVRMLVCVVDGAYQMHIVL